MYVAFDVSFGENKVLMWHFRSTSNDATPKGSVFQHAFSSPTADVILRSSDNVDFRVHKLILSEASFVFEDMFSLPPPTPTSTPSSARDDLPNVRMAESAETLNTLLGVLYPGKGPPLVDISVIGQVLAAADKYGMSGVSRQLEHVLLQRHIVEKEPMKVYALACHHGMQHAATVAARETLLHPMLGSYMLEFSLMTGSAFYSLIEYRNTCVGLIESLLGPQTLRREHGRRRPVSMRAPEVVIDHDTCGACSRRRQYFNEYLRRVKENYASRVSGSSVKSPVLWSACMEDLKQCDKCWREFLPQLTNFNEKLAATLDSRIEQVSITDSVILFLTEILCQVKFTFRA